jgi:predicted alpha/beta-hydrolase family hydrolase
MKGFPIPFEFPPGAKFWVDEGDPIVELPEGLCCINGEGLLQPFSPDEFARNSPPSRVDEAGWRRRADLIVARAQRAVDLRNFFMQGMKDSQRTVYFNHGKESGPWGSKITKLVDVACKRGFAVESIDYQDLPDAGPRVERLLQSEARKAKGLVLVGSSMGGYVATVASSVLKPEGLFLLAPAFYMPGYPEQNPTPDAKTVSVVHGWSDDVIPVEHSIRFAQKFSGTTRMELHLIEDDHRLSAEVDFVAMLFGRFLARARIPTL